MIGKIWKAREYQKVAGKFIFKNKKAGLFMDMGLGKTVTVLTVLQVLKNEYFEVGKPLVIAPKRVVESVWLQEVETWQHLELKGVQVIGDEKQRIKALKTEA